MLTGQVNIHQDDDNLCFIVDIIVNQTQIGIYRSLRLLCGIALFWWDELSSLKEASVDSDKMWKYASKPRSGPIFSKRQSYVRASSIFIDYKTSSKDEWWYLL